MIIWDELEHGKQIFDKLETDTKRWEQKELKLLIKYMQLNEAKTKDIKDKLDMCCSDEIKYLDNKRKNNLFIKLIKQSENEELITNVSVNIYKSELDKIHSLNDVKKEKVLFALISYKKWLNYASKLDFDKKTEILLEKYKDNHDKCYDIKNKEFLIFDYFYMMKNDIFKTARLNTLNGKTKQDILYYLLSNGYIESNVVKTSEKDRRESSVAKRQMYKINWIHQEYKSFEQFKNEITFEENLDDEIVFTLNDFNNMFSYYEEYFTNNEYIVCSICNDRVVKKNYNQIYCSKCSNEIAKKDKKKKKTIVCIDCELDFEVEGVVKNKKRCDDCQHKKQLEYQKKSMNKLRKIKM